ncbi:MAG: pyrroline-5-carboxylate reductase [Dokdonella sp.]
MSSNPESSRAHCRRIAFVGGGTMARSLIGALINGGARADAIAVAEPNAQARQTLAHDFAIITHDNACAAASGADVLVLAVKPQLLRSVCAELAEIVAQTRPLVISIAAGIRIAQLRDWFATPLAIVRAMPNTPTLIGAGATGLIATPEVDAAQRAQAEMIFAGAGYVVWIEDEHLMDTVTALSGSGPAYFFVLVEALEDAAVAQGLPRETARALATQTCLGAGRMLAEVKESPTTLRERVTSPGGTTAAALDVFVKGGLHELAAQAMEAATRRGRELSEQYG